MLYLSADRSDRSPILNVLESTRAECRKRLWGITTAPNSETAMKSACRSGMTGDSAHNHLAALDPVQHSHLGDEQMDMTPMILAMNASSFRTPND